MGLFDLPAPFFAWIDGGLAQLLPPTARLVLWGIIGAAVAMALYRILSPQSRIARTKQQAAAARRALSDFDGEFSDAWPLMRRMIGLSFRQLGLVIGPTLIASLPLLCLIVWASSAYGYGFPPPDADVAVRASPPGFAAHWVADGDPGRDPGSPPRALVTDQTGEAVADIPLSAPIPILHKRKWWNALIGNPAGYIADSSPVESIEIDLPAREYLSFGPNWLRAWYVPFFAAMVLGSLAIKVAFRIE